MGRKVRDLGPMLFAGFHEEPERTGAYPRPAIPAPLSIEEAAAAYEDAESVPLSPDRIQEIVDYATGGDRFRELAEAVIRVYGFLDKNQFATAEAHLRSIIERLNLKEGARID